MLRWPLFNRVLLAKLVYNEGIVAHPQAGKLMGVRVLASGWLERLTTGQEKKMRLKVSTNSHAGKFVKRKGIYTWGEIGAADK